MDNITEASFENTKVINLVKLLNILMCRIDNFSPNRFELDYWILGVFCINFLNVLNFWNMFNYLDLRLELRLIIGMIMNDISLKRCNN